MASLPSFKKVCEGKSKKALKGCAGGDYTIIVITTKNECCTLLEIYKLLSFILYYLCIAYTEGQKHYNTRTKNQEKKSRRMTIMYSLNMCHAKVQITNTDCNILSIVTH